MATWHQEQAFKRNPVRFDSPNGYVVVIDPPNQMRAIYGPTTKELAEVYMRNMKANNPSAAKHAYILPPRK
jgi:hypothetical protein